MKGALALRPVFQYRADRSAPTSTCAGWRCCSSGSPIKPPAIPGAARPTCHPDTTRTNPPHSRQSPPDGGRSPPFNWTAAPAAGAGLQVGRVGDKAVRAQRPALVVARDGLAAALVATYTAAKAIVDETAARAAITEFTDT